MSEPRLAFKRIVLHLPQSPGDYRAVAATAQLAELLRVDLLATFIEDVTLIDAAGLPCVRELRALGGGWHPFDVPQLARELQHAETTARRAFAEAMRTSRIEARFTSARGSAADVISSLAVADDIIALIEPRNPAERVTQQFTRLLEAAFQGAAAVMLVPSAIARTKGSVVAIVAGPDDTSIATAIEIAAAAKERLVVVSPSGGLDPFASIAKRAGAAGVACDIVAVKHRHASAVGFAADLAGLNERLLVVTRGSFDSGLPAEIASLRGIPVLVTEPAQTAELAQSERVEATDSGRQER